MEKECRRVIFDAQNHPYPHPMNKALLSTLVVTVAFSASFSQSQYIDNYLSGTPVYTTIAGSSAQVSSPQDLEFKPNSNQLWVLNKGGSGGTTVIINNAGLSTQTTMYRKDSDSGHFWQTNGTGIAFGDNGIFGSSGETVGTSCLYSGVSEWQGDLEVYAKVFQGTSGMLGSHIYMNHQTPNAMGIAFDNNRVYWVFDGSQGNILKVDFVTDHGPGNGGPPTGAQGHPGVKLWRYTGVTVTRVPGVPSHLVVDKANSWLYFTTGAGKTLKRLKTTSGTNAGSLMSTICNGEVISGYTNMTGATVETIETFTTQPVGMDYYNNRLVVSHTNGDITIYNTSGTSPVKLGTVSTGQSGMRGIKIGTDGKIWFVNATANTVVRMAPASLSTLDAGIVKIVSPILSDNQVNTWNQNDYFGLGQDVCEPTVTPSVILINNGSATLTSVTINYKIDNNTLATYNWTGSLASTATTSVTLPSINVTPGPHKLTVFTSAPNGGTDQNLANDTKQGAFRAIAAASLPHFQGFSATTFPPTDWNYISIKNPGSTMTRVTTGGFGASTGSAKMDMFMSQYNNINQVDHLMSPQIDLTGAPSTTVLQFSVAYAQKGTAADALKVQVSTDCGVTWSNTTYNKAGATLATAPATTAAFTPSASQWRTETISLSNYVGQKAIFVFTVTGQSGNNLYLDDISFSGTTTGISENDLSSSVSVFPNPAADHVTISGDMLIDANISLRNVIGEEMMNVSSLSNNMELSLSTIPNGIYFLNIRSENGIATKKIIVNK